MLRSIKFEIVLLLLLLSYNNLYIVFE